MIGLKVRRTRVEESFEAIEFAPPLSTAGQIPTLLDLPGDSSTSRLIICLYGQLTAKSKKSEDSWRKIYLSDGRILLGRQNNMVDTKGRDITQSFCQTFPFRNSNSTCSPARVLFPSI